MSNTRDPRHNAWLTPPAPVIAGIQMRPITAGSIELCRELGITFLDDFKTISEAGEAEAQRQLFTFLFIHGYSCGDPRPEVIMADLLRIVRLPREEFTREHLIPWSMPIPMFGLLPQLIEWIALNNKGTLEGIFDILKKLSPEGAEDPPNSSSPPGSQPSSASSRAKAPSRAS